ncbi:type IV secretory system conjugative DNA transfer family protein [Streptomyces anulatus]|uniref:type IV secretory system conjugative DNA transfer family protein n=1 Tax=Streptomyces anulatus TaxID=1892 RepID=UPI002250CCAE|nr:type IV secretory system conjugative DNA transfer family protein [Streptomyces anulatus]MCX4519367.1 type IV secretory system conjugative DNA transfer family protein [Streptomyces anulatus]MCX4602248.1 type IV secretory system conjugative DNA transfer family protein [Streptomyces anulatus]WTD27026.1 type IV secretory system conjugative DNA transfer family protein [Streptomyces anulatus]
MARQAPRGRGNGPAHHDGYDDRPQGGGGIPDGLLIGLLGLLFAATLVAWTATGLAGLFTHGAWPDGVTFTRSPLALRELATAPQDLAAAWPGTPPAQLSGYGLFWGLFIGELMVLVVLAVFTLGVVARGRAVRERRREERAFGTYEKQPASRGTAPATTPTQTPAAAPATAPPPADHTAETTPAPEHAPPPSKEDPRFTPEAPTPQQAPQTTQAPQTPTVPGLHDTPGTSGTSGTSGESPGTTPSSPLLLPSPRTPLLVYAPAPARRPTVVRAVHDAEGPVLVVTSDPTVWAETKDARAKLGPVLVYDPGHLCDTPARLHWSPTERCELPDIAAARAAALLAPVRPQARIDAAVADTAQTLLQCWLHAAAVDGRPFRQVLRWASGSGAHEPVRLLRTHPKAASGLAGLLESALTAYPERREVAQELTVRAFAALSTVHIREACTANRADSLALESFVDEGGTLYLVGEPIEDPRSRPGAMPLLTALAADVVEHGRRMAARSSDGRLDPPMTLVLDDVAAVAPLPQLPELLTTGQHRGMPTLVLLRSREQGRARWQERLHAPAPGAG